MWAESTVGRVGQPLARLGEILEVHEDDRGRHPRLLVIGGRIDQEPLGDLPRQGQAQQGAELLLRHVELVIRQDVHEEDHGEEHAQDQEELDLVRPTVDRAEVEVRPLHAAVHAHVPLDVTRVGGGPEAPAQRPQMRDGQGARDPGVDPPQELAA